MRTGYVAQHGKEKGAILIVQAPRAVGIVTYKNLYPGTYKDEVDRDTFEWCYRHLCLRHLNPLQVWNDLHDAAYGHEPVLVTLRRDVLACHRRLVADWLTEELGYDVPECDRPVQLSLLAG